MRKTIVFIVMSLFLLSSKSEAGIILLDALAQASTFEDGSFLDGPLVDWFGDTLFTQGSSTAEANFRQNSSTIEFTYQKNGDVATFDISHAFSIVDGQSPDLLHGNESYGIGYGHFAVTADTRYELTSWMNTTGQANLFRGVELYDDSGTLLYGFARGRDPFWGPTYGDYVDILVGSDRGILQAGNSYNLYAFMDLCTFEDNGPSSSNGGFRLSMDASVSAVPEPSTFCAGSLAIIVGALWKRKALVRTLVRH